MTVRFRIRTPAGQEVSFASRSAFEDFVRSGDLSPEDLVYDAEDGSWAPARTHPIVLDIQYEEEEAEAAAADVPDEVLEARSSEGAERVGEESPTDDADVLDATDATAPADTESGDAFGLSLAPAPETEDEGSTEATDEGGASESAGFELEMTEGLSVEQAQQAFVERMEAERASELDTDLPGSGFKMERAGSLAEVFTPEPESGSPARRGTPRPGRLGPAHDDGGPERGSGAPPGRRPAPTRGGGGGVGGFVGAVVLLGIVAAGSYYGFRYVQGEEEAPITEGSIEPIPVEVEVEPEPEPEIARTVSAVRERARERFLTSTQAALRDLESVPESWAGGAYLAEPSATPQVVDVWQSYLSTVRQVRVQDAARYLVAYEAALDDAIIEGEERSTRTEAALVAFDSTTTARNAHWDRVEALASAALQSHDALVEVEGLLIWEGSGDGAGGPIGAGVTTRDEDSELLLEQVVELLTSTLEAEGLGPGSGDNVRAWVWDGFLDAMTR